MPRFLVRFLSVFSLALGLGLCVGLVFWQGLSRGDASRLWDGLSFGWLIAVFLLSWTLMLCGEEKWRLLAQSFHGEKGSEPYSGFFLRHYLWQNWIAQFVPPALAIALGRGWATRRMGGGSVASGIGNGIVDLAMDFAALCVFFPGAFLVLFFGAGWTGFLIGTCCGLSFFLFACWGARRFVKAPWRGVLWSMAGLSFAKASLILIRLLAGVKAFSLSLALLPVAALTPVVALVSLIPLTPGNLGLAEWGWVGGLAYAGQSTRDAALYALGFRLLVLVAQTLLLGLNEAYVRLGKKPSAL